MAHGNEDHARPEPHDTLAQLVAKRAGISGDQARELIRLIGTGRNSLLPEAICSVSVALKQPVRTDVSGGGPGTNGEVLRYRPFYCIGDPE